MSYDVDPEASSPKRWLEFIGQVLPDDPDAIRTIQEIFGYLLTPDSSPWKVFLFVGPRRAGKGRIARVLTALVGEQNCVAPTCSGLAGPFGLEPLLRKRLAIVADAQFDHQNSKAYRESLLAITGEDMITVARKYKGAYTVRLPVRFLVISNSIPRVADPSGAFAGRFVVVQFTRSFFGRESPRLTEELMEEVPGILSWAREGLFRLQECGKFALPETGQAIVSDMEASGSPGATRFVTTLCSRAWVQIRFPFAA